jgi:hypothetical protein
MFGATVFEALRATSGWTMRGRPSKKARRR